MRRLLRRFLGLPEPLAITAASAPPVPDTALARELTELRADVDVLIRQVKQVRGMVTGGAKKSLQETAESSEAPSATPSIPEPFIGPWLRHRERA